MGTIGDLGTSFKWERPFPDMTECFKKYTKKTMNEAVSLLNARMSAELRSCVHSPLMAYADAILIIINPAVMNSPEDRNLRCHISLGCPPDFLLTARDTVIQIALRATSARCTSRGESRSRSVLSQRAPVLERRKGRSAPNF